MKKKTPHHFPELQEATESGYADHFIFRNDHTLQCLGDNARIYELEEVTVEAISCTSIPATLYLIITDDGRYRGTAIEFWEHY